MPDQERIINGVSHRKIITLAKIDVLEMMDILKTCDKYLNKIPKEYIKMLEGDDVVFSLHFRVNHLFKVLDTELKNNDEDSWVI